MSLDIMSAQQIVTVPATRLVQHCNNTSLTHPLTKWHARRKACVFADSGYFEHVCNTENLLNI